MFRARRCSSHPRLVSGTLNNGICFGGFSKGESRRCFSGDRLPVGHLALDPKELIPDTTGLYSASALSSKERRLKEERRLNEERWLNEERRTNEVKKAQAQPKTVTLPLLTFDALREVTKATAASDTARFLFQTLPAQSFSLMNALTAQFRTCSTACSTRMSTSVDHSFPPA